MSRWFRDNDITVCYDGLPHERTVRDVETLARGLVGDATLRLTIDSPETLAAIERFCAAQGYTLTRDDSWAREGARWLFGRYLVAIHRA